MWTPKRILILLGSTLLFGAAFLVYSLVLGGIDGLPALPPDLVRLEGDVEFITPERGKTDEKIALAFGPGADEAGQRIALDLGSRGILFTFHEFHIEDDGRVKLTNFSAALFPKNRQGGHPEINTVQCELAFLTLDRPVKIFSEIGSRKIIGVELRGNRGVTLLNNRRTPEKHDDVELRITTAPVYYEERSQKIWTDGFIKLLDQQTQPNPTEITAKGLELFLTKDGAAPKTAKGPSKGKERSKGEQLNGVELLVLKSHVDMHLWVDAKDGFLAAPQDLGVAAAKPRPAPAPNEKSHIIIKTSGPFRYEIPAEMAQFDSPPAPANAGPGAGEQVLVSREHKVGKGKKIDQLLCDNLKLHFRRVENPGRDSRNSKEIETALATARPGKEVILTMDSENLEAYGTELFYRSPTATVGPQTILKGNPLHAIREGHKIMARELHLIGADKKGNGQQAFAKGPGRIDIYGKDKAGDKAKQTMHALWQDSLIATKDRDGDRVFDLLTFTGDATFIDNDQGQSLQAQRLQVWLEQVQGEQDNKQQASGGSRQKPHKLEAFERVSVRSAEMIVKNCKHLVVCFKEMPAADDMLPDVVPAPIEVKGVTPMPQTAAAPEQAAPKQPAPQQTAAKLAEPRPLIPGLPGPADKDKPRKPITLSANDVVAYIGTQGTKKQLQELVTEGNVHVTQEGETPKDKGVDITGENLNLVYHPLGNTLYVMGDARKPAQLQLGELIIIGHPKVTISQRDNIAEVDGIGAMTMPSKTTLEGGVPAKPGTTITIHWNKDMLFDGKFARFHGGVQAFQDSASLKCQTLQVTLDRAVSFKEGQKADQNANVERLVCDKQVFIEEVVKGTDGKLKSYKRLQSPGLSMDNLEGLINAPGPGSLRHIAPGNGELSMAAPGAAPKPVPVSTAPAGPAKDLPLRLTRIDFEGRMYANNKTAAKTAIFYDNVEVYNLIADDPDVKVMPNQPPKDGFYMRCGVLRVTTSEQDKKVSQNMIASNNVFFRTPEFYGSADTVKYDESQDQIIFEGAPANLYKLGAPGARPEQIQGKRILYNRRLGTFHLDGGTVISAQ